MLLLVQKKRIYYLRAANYILNLEATLCGLPRGLCKSKSKKLLKQAR